MFEMRQVGKDTNQNRGRQEMQMRGEVIMTRHKINKENCEYIMYREKSSAKADGKTYIWIPVKSSITLKDLMNFSDITVEQVGKKGVWLKLN